MKSVETKFQEWFTPKEFCEYYRCSHATFYRLANTGKLNPRKLGSATRISRADADAWAASLPTYQKR